MPQPKVYDKTMTPPKLRGKALAAYKQWLGHAKSLGYKDEADMLEGLYKSLGSMHAVAHKLGYCRSTVYKHMVECGLKFNTRGGIRRGKKHEDRFKGETHGASTGGNGKAKKGRRV